MANTRKTNNTELNNSEQDNNLHEQNTKLQSEVNELKSLVQQLLQNQQTQKEQNIFSQNDFQEIDDEVEVIPPNKLINVTSLFYGGMSLTGSKPLPIRFEKFGITLPITFEDLTMICSNHRSLAESGAFFIHSKEAVKSLYLTENYKIFVNKQTIENIMTLPDEEIRSIFKTTTNEIKETIIDIVIAGVKQYITNGDMKYSNRNKIELLSELSGKNIFQLANESVELDKE